MMNKNKNKKKRLPSCIICGRIDRSRLVTRYKLMDWPPYVICLGCINKAEEMQNKNRYDWRIEKPKEDENENR